MREQREIVETDMAGIDSMNYLTEGEPHFSHYENFVTSLRVRKAIHAGTATKFVNENVENEDDFHIATLRNTKAHLEYLLEEDYDILIYHGQTDALLPFPSTERAIQELNWKNKRLYE